VFAIFRIKNKGKIKKNRCKMLKDERKDIKYLRDLSKKHLDFNYILLYNKVIRLFAKRLLLFYK